MTVVKIAILAMLVSFGAPVWATVVESPIPLPGPPCPTPPCPGPPHTGLAAPPLGDAPGSQQTAAPPHLWGSLLARPSGKATLLLLPVPGQAVHTDALTSDPFGTATAGPGTRGGSN